LKTEFSVVDAVERSQHLDENLWPQLVTRFDNLDVLHAGRVNPNLRIEPGQIRNLIAFMRRNYDAMVFDVSGNLEKYSIEIMHESAKVFLVCTPEVSSLHLARERMHFLRTFNLEGKVSVILNRCDNKKALLKKSEIEELLELPVVQMFTNDYQGVGDAINAGTWIDPNAKMGKLFTEFAETLLDVKSMPSDRRHKFLEFFTSGPSRPLAPVNE
jgi:pilus assembly protein CpaE